MPDFIPYALDHINHQAQANTTLTTGTSLEATTVQFRTTLLVIGRQRARVCALSLAGGISPMSLRWLGAVVVVAHEGTDPLQVRSLTLIL